MAVSPPPVLTVEDYRDLPETGPRYQLIKGELFMSPAPPWHHQIISRNIQFALLKFFGKASGRRTSGGAVRRFSDEPRCLSAGSSFRKRMQDGIDSGKWNARRAGLGRRDPVSVLRSTRQEFQTPCLCAGRRWRIVDRRSGRQDGPSISASSGREQAAE